MMAVPERNNFMNDCGTTVEDDETVKEVRSNTHLLNEKVTRIITFPFFLNPSKPAGCMMGPPGPPGAPGPEGK